MPSLKEMIYGINEENKATLSIGEIADGLGITRKTLSLLLNERQGLSIEMALRLADKPSRSDHWNYE